ncbi:ATP-binding cassette glutathione S-conjugate transporter ycf1, partial [Linderina pennispora]
MLLALARFAGGQLAFRLVNFIGIQALFQSKADVTLSLRAFGITLHLFMLMVDLDGQGWHELRDNVQSALYAKEIALIRLGRVRELTIDDFWALPERFQLHAAHREFKYDENETLFVIRGIIRMIWRPYLPLVVFQSLFRIAVVSQSVLFTMVLMCIENPSTHAWYEPYLYLAANFSLQLIKSQAERVNRLLDQEEQRVKDSIKFEILRCALANLGKGGTNDMYVTHLVGSVMRGLRTVVSEISSVVTAVFALWLTYRQIGWISVIPIVVLVSLSLVSMSLDYLRRVCGYSRYTVWTSRVDARDIYSNIKTIKFNGWEQKYLDPTLVLNDDPDAYDSVKIPKKYRRLVDAFISTAQTANSILRNVSSQLAIFFTVNLYLQSGETLSSVELLQIIEQITQVKNNAQSVLSSYYLIAEAVNDNLRLEGYLTAEPTNGIAVQPGLPEAGPSIEMKDSTFTHTKKVETNVLEGVSLSIGRGQLVSVKGGVASGKTSLLLAMCGEVEMRSGAGHVTGRIGYLGQSPYIMNGTLRENILFGRDFDESLYWRVMEACALMGDADQWPKRDMTLIGERGINISGGQKARLALARAVYTQADVYILDDPLSAVDAQIKRHLLDNVLLNTGLLGNKLRVVSMNSNHLDAFANQNITVDKGQVTVEIQEHPRLHSLATLHGSCPEGGSGDDTMSEGSTSTLTNYVKPSSRRGDSRREHATKDLDMDKGINWDDAKYALDILGLPVLVLTLFTATFHPVSDYITEGYKLDALNKNSVAADPHAIGTYLWYQMLAATITNVVNTAESMLKRNIADKYVEERVINMFTRSLVYAPMSLFDSSSKQDIDSKFWMCKNELARRLPMLIQTNVSTILSISLSMYRVSRKAPLLLLIAPAMAIAMNHVGKLVIPTYRAVRKITRSFKIEQSRIRDILSDSSRTIRLHGVEGYFTSIHKGNVDEGVR